MLKYRECSRNTKKLILLDFDSVESLYTYIENEYVNVKKDDIELQQNHYDFRIKKKCDAVLLRGFVTGYLFNCT